MVQVLLLRQLDHGYVVVQYYTARYVVHISKVQYTGDIPYVHLDDLCTLYTG